MPSSDPITISRVLKLVEKLGPMSILDIGPGNGRYGFLFRELLDLNYGRFARKTWQVVIDGVEVERRYLSPVHDFVYNVVHVANWLSEEVIFQLTYDLAFMGDILEHFREGEWQKALMKARRYSKATIVVCPNWRGSISQGPWGGNEFETHRVELTPAKVGGRCLFANSKCFITAFDNIGSGLLEGKEILP